MIVLRTFKLLGDLSPLESQLNMMRHEFVVSMASTDG
jgi:hypothetical protein